MESLETEPDWSFLDESDEEQFKILSSRAIGLVRSHLSEIEILKSSNTRTASLKLLKETFEEENLQQDLLILFRLQKEFNLDQFNYDDYKSTWMKYLPKIFSPEGKVHIKKHLDLIKSKKMEKTRVATFEIMEEDIENLTEDYEILKSIKPNLKFSDPFDLKTYTNHFLPHLEISHANYR